jgi:3-hydroxyisobutyrate dehydrogenase-like beta-hydroxyacid dehydrogenase
MSALPCICLIGFGEVGVTLADDLLARGVEFSAWDIKFPDRASKPAREVAVRQVRAGANAQDAVAGAEIVVSAVTAAQTVDAARAAAPAIQTNAIFLDLNSASPAAKNAAAKIVNAAGGFYVEAAVMSPIAPKRIATPMLFGGPHAEQFLTRAHDIGLVGATAFSKTYGQAAAAKLCRSVMVKGVEALLTESLLAARHYGVEAAVLGSLSDLFPGPDWPNLARYMISRALEHGGRRAEEMREAALTVEAAGLAPMLSRAIAERQDWAAEFAAALDKKEIVAMLDSIRSAMPTTRRIHDH